METPYWALTWRPEGNGKHLEFNLALSGRTLLLSAELENISIDTSGDILVIQNLKDIRRIDIFW